MKKEEKGEERERERERYGERGNGDNESERACRDVGHQGGRGREVWRGKSGSVIGGGKEKQRERGEGEIWEGFRRVGELRQKFLAR